ncbi:hypothetical protein DXG01_009959 [Tephrocybe rancida]|nr:hypothetical protein DXG01_009959 [Tephrocybe rancida]
MYCRKRKLNGWSLTLQEGASPPPPATDSTPLSTISRKRRLSDADGQGAPKRLCNLFTSPRLQTVSDPLPMAPSALFEVPDIDNWLNTNFGASSPVNVDPLDDALGLELDFYTYSASEVGTPSTATESLAGQSHKCAQSIENMPPLIPDDALPNGPSICMNSVDYNELFDVCEDPVFSHTDALLSQPPLLDLSFFTNLSAVPSYSDQAVSIAETHPTLIDPAVWYFPPFDMSTDPPTPSGSRSFCKPKQSNNGVTYVNIFHNV